MSSASPCSHRRRRSSRHWTISSAGQGMGLIEAEWARAARGRFGADADSSSAGGWSRTEKGSGFIDRADAGPKSRPAGAPISGEWEPGVLIHAERHRVRAAWKSGFDKHPATSTEMVACFACAAVADRRPSLITGAILINESVRC